MCGGLLFAQSQIPTMPTMPSMPDMPEVGGGFYRPTVPNPKKTEAKKNAENQNTEEKKETVISDAKTKQNTLSSLLDGDINNLLSANDISTLYDSGMFGSLSSLSGANTIAYGANSSTTNILLNQILGSLEGLKEEQKKVSPAEAQNLEDIRQDSETFKTRSPAILRFKINGYNIADSLTASFFSEPENDGSFLLTADRKYYANQRMLNETFYMLFRTTKSAGSVTTYEVVPTIAQEVKNPYSFVYKFCKKEGITAEKTGNLVVIHFEDGDITADMLLDIDK